MPESYSPTEFIAQLNSQNPNGAKFDPYNTQTLRQKLLSQQTQTPEAKIAKAEQEIQDMKLWLLTEPNHTYTPEQIDEIISRLTVRYDESSHEAIVSGNLYLSRLDWAEGLPLPKNFEGNIRLTSLTPMDRDALRNQRPDLANKIWPEEYY